MAAIKRSRARPKEPDLQAMLELHVRGTRRVRELLALCQRLRDQGKRAAAKLALAKAEKIQTVLRALEAEVRGSGVRSER